jgi:hypothetical protein
VRFANARMNSSSVLPLFHVVGFSGHRSVANPAGVARAITTALALLRQEAAGEWIALSSIAIGSDQLFVKQAQALGLSWHAILPLPKAEFQKDFLPAEWLTAEELLACAEHERVIAENGSREDAYLDCGMETVDGADVLIAVWDGQPARGKGGTAEVVHYAKSLDKPVLVIDAVTLELRRENFERLERTDQTLVNLNSLPVGSAGWGENPFDAPAPIFAFQQKCDFAASHGAPQFRRLIVLTVGLHVLATLIAAAALSFDLHFTVIPWLKLLCLAGALGVAVILRQHHHSQHNWVRCRLAAEFCRSGLATWGLPRAAPLFEDLDLPIMRGLTRSLGILHTRSAGAQPVSMEEFRRIYLEKRIDDQLKYYRRQEARAVPLLRRLRLGFWVATLLAMTCTLAYAVCHTAHLIVPPALETSLFYFLPIALPVIAASFISLISINDLQRRVARFREMQLNLSNSRQRVMFCQTWNSLEKIVSRTERAILQEVLEWHSITSFAESH